MRGRLAWLVGILALLLLYRRLRARRGPFDNPPDLRAEELRRKLDESRSIVTEREQFETAETPVDRASSGADVEDRRRKIHERGKAALDEMRGASSD